MQQRPSGTTLIVIILLSGIVFAGANLLVLLQTTSNAMGIPLLEQFYRVCPPCVIYFVAAPFVVSILVALMVRRLAQAPAMAETATAAPAAPPPPPSPDLALRLLGFLQQEGRIVDFLQEDITAYGDAQVGAAVRAIHAGCRKALDERVELQRIFAAEEGTTVTVEPGFDPSAVRLSGNVTGTPPFRGTLQHAGWRATRVTLPPAPEGSDPTVVAPAEVEIP